MCEQIKRALLVGINYRGSQCELGGCINDVLTVKDLLVNKYGYKDENIVLLTDDTEYKPTNKNIIEGLKWLLSTNSCDEFGHECKPLDSSLNPELFFHYSGHGGYVIDTDGDEVDGFDETLCPIDYLTCGMITDDTIRDTLVVNVPENGKLFCIVDACHSGSSLDLLWNVKAESSTSFNLCKIGTYAPTKGDVILLSGCKDEQTSSDIEINGKGTGALTYAFIQVLKESNYDITYDKLLLNIRDYIHKNELSDQTPCMSFGKAVDIDRKFSL